MTAATSPPLIVAGMHRSGTSFVASLLHRGGCDMGGALLAADANNRRGYFEDLHVLALNRRMLAAAMPTERPGHPDWGWVEDADEGGVDAGLLAPFVAEADAWIARRRDAVTDAARQAAQRGDANTAAVAWGWKDPRTTVLLDFWDARAADARYIFVYRAPWDVADSMQRLGAAEFLRHPAFAHRIWQYYNRALLAFVRRYPERTLLVNANAVLREPRQLLRLVRDHLGVTLDDTAAETVADASLLASAGTELSRLAAAVHPECVDLLSDLEDAAALPSGQPLPPPLTAAPTPADPRLAIVIPCFNQGEFLLDAIASVEQTVTVPYGLVIVNDGSTDRHTIDALARLRRAGYRVLDQDNRGVAAARNRGIREAGCDIVLPLDADNRLRPGFVSAALEVLARDASVMAVYGDRREFGLRTARVAVGVPDLNRLLCGNYIDACAVLRRDAWRACGGYDQDMPAQGAEDWDLWLGMLSRGFTLHRLDTETFDYRVRPDSMLVQTMDPEVQGAIDRYVLAKHAPLYLRHLREQVDRLESLTAALAEAGARHTASGSTASAAPAAPAEPVEPAALPHPSQSPAAIDRPITA